MTLSARLKRARSLDKDSQTTIFSPECSPERLREAMYFLSAYAPA
jgi:hypothetical protein